MVGAKIPIAFRDLWTPSRYKAYYGGRGSAKSQSISLALVTMAREKKLRILCCREFQNSMKDSSKLEIENRISECGLGYFFRTFNNEIVGLNGSTFLFSGLRNNPDSVKSMAGIDIAWVEEAATISKRSLGILIPTIRKDGSEIWFTWNPRNPDDPVDAMFRGPNCEKAPDAIVRRVNHDDNKFLPETLRQTMLRDQARDPDFYRFTWLGEYQQSSEARVFHNWDVKEFETPSNVSRFYYGADWGFVDPTVLVRCFIDSRKLYKDDEDFRANGQKLYIDHEIVRSNVSIVDTPALFDKVPGSRVWPITADSSGAQTIDFMKKAGFKISPSRKGPDSIVEGIEFLKNYDIIVHPRCLETAKELSRYSYQTEKLTEAVLPKLEDKHNHVIDALRYSIESLRKSQYPTAVVGSYQTRR